jgi:phosphoglycolate phosphatase-like HAD superfamily hydrolase
MRKQAILIDLDNTVIDTAIRKHAILKDFLPRQTVSEQKVREDFDLVSVLGPDDTDASTSFFEILDSENGILNYQAPIFPGVIDFFKKNKEIGISIVLITGRPDSLRNATIEELRKANIDNYISELYMRGSNHSSMKDFKISQIKIILQLYDIIVSIGDRLDDLEAAEYHSLPFIFIRTTLSSQTVLDPKNLQIAGGAICMTWNEIDAATDTIIEGRKKLSTLREIFTDSYANWLSDLDNKCRITATISGILATISGKMTMDRFYSMVIIDGSRLVEH